MSDNYTPWESGSAPASWSEVVWPTWVPFEVRMQIESFWSASCNRGPADYEKSASSSYNGGCGRAENIPKFGEIVTLPSWGPVGFHTGRWVHAWNNIGRVIEDDGTVHCSSTCDYRGETK